MTLIEALAAAAILTGGLLAVMQAVQISIRAQVRSEVHATAARLAAEKMDEIRKEPEIAAGEETGDFGESFPDYRWEASIAETDLPGLDEVAIVVTCEFAGREEEYVLTSLQREASGESPQTE
jgi:Tfp pilus assembly protein PilV